LVYRGKKKKGAHNEECYKREKEGMVGRAILRRWTKVDTAFALLKKGRR